MSKQIGATHCKLCIEFVIMKSIHHFCYSTPTQHLACTFFLVRLLLVAHLDLIQYSPQVTALACIVLYFHVRCIKQNMDYA